TTPGRSAETTTPCTAVTDPIAGIAEDHSSDLATTVVTLSGGIWNAFCCAMPFEICRYLTAPITPTKARIASTVTNIRFFMKPIPPPSVPRTLSPLYPGAGVRRPCSTLEDPGRRFLDGSRRPSDGGPRRAEVGELE